MDGLAPKCPRCGEITKQMIRGWKDGWTNYRCGHCQKRYKIEDEANG